MILENDLNKCCALRLLLHTRMITQAYEDKNVLPGRGFK